MADSAADRAYKRAVAEIQRVKLSGGRQLDLKGDRFRALDRIPLEISILAGLHNLNLSQTAVSDLSPLAGLTELQKLNVEQTAVTDLSPLAGLTSLQWLILERTAISGLAPLAKLTALQKLDLDHAAITDLTPLVRLTALQWLILDQTAVADLSPLAGLTALQRLVIDQTAVTDLAPLAGLTALTDLRLEGTSVADLRPVRALRNLGTGRFSGLSFQSTLATTLDSELARLANISDTRARARDTLAYLSTLPSWPEPYIPRSRKDGRPPQAIGSSSEQVPRHPALLTAEAQIGALLRYAAVTRVTAAQLSEQIASALRDLPATEGNQLPPVLQLMSEFGEVLSLLGGTRLDERHEERNLRLRIAQLEAVVERLTGELREADAARTAAEALAQKDGFAASFRKASGTAAGAGTVALIGVGVPTAAVYFLGADHPLVQAFLTVVGRLPK